MPHTPYTAPLQDLLFDLQHLAGLDQIAQLPGCEDATLETAQAVLQECAKLAEEVLAPLNASGDTSPPTWQGGAVKTSPGFQQAYHAYVAGGWQGLQHPPAYGGQGLPKTLAAACSEIINAANMSFALCPLLTNGAIEALLTAGSESLKKTYLAKLVSGQWSGTMNLTEPQAGSDLAQVRTRAELQPDGRYKLFGTKIYITYGEHDLAENIVHLVLARVSGAPEGVKGLSLFVCPKFLPQADGTLGERNDVQCLSIEHKLGIKASPTAVLQYGDQGGAWAELVGGENHGLAYMFIMMNAARFAVGVQGVAMAERAYQQAAAFAQARVQSRAVDAPSAGSVAIVEHPDVKRMLMTMRASTQGCRALALVTAAVADTARHHTDAAVRTQQQAMYEWMVPVLKGYSTEMSLEVTSLAMQVHGGMGYIAETGVAQHYRDARILTIYEGTTAIQANDFLGRKTVRDQGQTARAMAQQIALTEADLHRQGSPDALAVAMRLQAARQDFLAALAYMLDNFESQPQAVFAGSVPYLMLTGHVLAAWQLARSLLAAQTQIDSGVDKPFMQAKIITARFFADHTLGRASSLRRSICEGADSVTRMSSLAF